MDLGFQLGLDSVELILERLNDLVTLVDLAHALLELALALLQVRLRLLQLAIQIRLQSCKVRASSTARVANLGLGGRSDKLRRLCQRLVFLSDLHGQ